jgi:hypothetical protein
MTSTELVRAASEDDELIMFAVVATAADAIKVHRDMGISQELSSKNLVEGIRSNQGLM